ncbi:putative F420-dependent oxidoreductase family protein [Mycolicibacterium hassiacum DSM 44199]|uniref:Putative F420-dependent oxidoreductase family protein n=1 Tax=Mycolicibacterium hassiacum (strain DSM 44199 / CIP 105218 / JCM 12690 / 3849) TaxID=1122247 RepID=K5BH67_MYCHD|nr:LLM class F420-dependent oxidoreductase [Mycolicibacterium hassiacum]EKF25407.1 putative F420-dependent oxidoreductase family protein [Mycolicibacterium hassiacum DSM 44199]MBX5488971.1 LLM class F420-dependent oxidoreductase [Mycolicibacterium hassiacum]MDA4086116.1 F420-dependent oxidoreductase [Mycolicibacterium hassiacum DSM 44199]VCT92934.1 F420-dependent hydroxymycolic acid dehydrogenase [Mycolicibacterium hassiacum DSM 44199]
MTGHVDFRVFVEPQQGATYADQLAVARAAEQLGYSAFFRSDHYLAMSGDGLPGPTDSWVTLAGIARETSSIRLGTLVTSATFRYPGPLAIAVAQVDEMSDGRVEFGLGAGWFEPEHQAYAIPFPDTAERFERLAEQLEIITGLWTTPHGEKFDFAGKYYTVVDSPGLPKPLQVPHPPVVVGGLGAKRTPALAARYASEFNVPFVRLDTLKTQYERVAAAVADAGRPADSMTYSAAFVVCAGRDEAEIARRAAAIGREVEELRSNSPVVGTPAEIVDRLGPFIEAGVQRVYLQVLDMSDLAHLEFFAGEVIPQLR